MKKKKKEETVKGENENKTENNITKLDEIKN